MKIHLVQVPNITITHNVGSVLQIFCETSVSYIIHFFQISTFLPLYIKVRLYLAVHLEVSGNSG